MHSRLLSFLADFERALRADDPSPEDGSWQTSRAVNYRSGLARLQLAVHLPDRSTKPRGGVTLQSYHLADGTPCLKAQLNWGVAEPVLTHAIFAKPGCDWKSEARRLAALWMAGAPAVEAMPAAAAAVSAVAVAS